MRKFFVLNIDSTNVVFTDKAKALKAMDLILEAKGTGWFYRSKGIKPSEIKELNVSLEIIHEVPEEAE